MHNMDHQPTKNKFIIEHEEEHIPVVRTATGEIQWSASFNIVEQTAIARILSDMDTELVAGDFCPKWQRREKESYNLVMSLTALDLPPEALKKYRPLEAIRRRRAKQSAEISSRRRRAMLTARKAARLLKTEFGAKEVILFGSLARRVGFTLWSDIDLAVRGIDPEKFFAAFGAIERIDVNFQIDLVELETCLPALVKSIEEDGKPL
jgi:predicted nucleotidyltransferase